MSETLYEPARDAVRSSMAPLQQVTAPVARWHDDDCAPTSDELVAEEPLELRLRATGDAAARSETLAVIMRTPGRDDELAAGFLFAEGIVARREEISAILPGSDPDGLPSPH